MKFLREIDWDSIKKVNFLLTKYWELIETGGYRSSYDNYYTKAAFEKAAADLGLKSAVVEPISYTGEGGKIMKAETVNRLVITDPDDIATFERAIGAHYLATHTPI